MDAVETVAEELTSTPKTLVIVAVAAVAVGVGATLLVRKFYKGTTEDSETEITK